MEFGLSGAIQLVSSSLSQIAARELVADLVSDLSSQTGSSYLDMSR